MKKKRPCRNESKGENSAKMPPDEKTKIYFGQSCNTSLNENNAEYANLGENVT